MNCFIIFSIYLNYFLFMLFRKDLISSIVCIDKLNFKRVK